MTEHVLVVGIDGARYDAVRRLPTPHLDQIQAQGFLVAVPVDPVAPTISGPSWSSILTGTLASDHGVFDNDFTTSHFDLHPDVLSIASQQRPGLATFAAAGWEPLVRAASGGPLIALGGHFPGAVRSDDVAGWSAPDDAVVVATTGWLDEHDGTAGSLAFAYLHGPDLAGHGPGTGPEYDQMIVSSDERLGLILAALARRVAARPAERWTVIVATDHGHRDGGGHGGDDHHERTAWIAACGPGISPGAPVSAEQVDVAGHVIATLGLVVDDDAVVGRAFGTRSAR